MNLWRLFLSSGVFIAIILYVSHVFFPLSQLVIDEDRGEALFAENCAGCHNLTPDGSLVRGPSLHNVGKWAGNRAHKMSAEEFIFESIVEPDAYRTESAQGNMPGRFAEEISYRDILNITGYLVGKSQDVDYTALLRNPPPEIATNRVAKPSVAISEIERGEHLYKNLCISCHDIEVLQNYDLYYPSLRQVGVHNKSYLREAILEPSKSITPGYEHWTLRTRDGETFVGRLVYEDASLVRLVTASSDGFSVKELAKSSLVPFENGQLMVKSAVSEMPPLGLALSEQDLEALVTFLTFL